MKHSDDFIIAWANVLTAVRSGELDRRVALKRITTIIRGSNDAEIRRFLRKARWRILWIRKEARP